MDYQIAIPSHGRAKTFYERTWAFLRQCGVDVQRVTVFLSDERDATMYAPIRVRTVVTGARDLTAKFNVIHRHYEPGSPVFVIEDDVELLEAVEPGTNAKRGLRDLDKLVHAGFACVPNGGLWGVSPHSNVFFYTGKTTSTLKLVVAHAFGFVSTHDPALEVTAPSKTDYERTCLYWLRYGETWRLDWCGCKTTSYTQPGGLQSDLTKPQRAAAEDAACAQLVERFPTLLRRKAKASSPFSELQFLRGV